MQAFALARKRVRATAAFLPNETSTYLLAKKFCLARFSHEFLAASCGELVTLAGPYCVVVVTCVETSGFGIPYRPLD